METKEIEVIKAIIQELVEKMGFSAEVEVKENQAEPPMLIGNIQTADSSFLIGQYGINLQALQHIARILVRKKTEDKINFVLDVNAYRQDKDQALIKLAQEAAEQCLREKRAIVLRPMTAYERRLIHMELAAKSELKTESVGEGENRKVVVKPSELV